MMSNNNTYANMIPRSRRTPTTSVTTTSGLTVLTPEEEASDQPPPPPKSRPPADTPPPLPPMSSATVNHSPSSKVLYSTVNHNHPTHRLNHHHQKPSQDSPNDSSSVPDSQFNAHVQRPTSQVRTYVRSPGNFLSASNGQTSSSLTPTPVDEESFLNSLSREDLTARIRIVESKNRKLMLDNGQLMKDLNHHVNQLQGFKHQCFQLRGDNHELRDLCCYLDDERNRARALAKEWQEFGTHMSRVMRHEVSSYAKKLSQLEEKQFELVKENFELKQLCVLLDNAMHSRGDINHVVDGSTGSGSMASSTEHDSMTNHAAGVGGQVPPRPPRPGAPGPTIINTQTLDYIRSLESRVRQLEFEKKQFTSDMASATNTIDSTYTNRRRHMLPPMSPTRELSSPPAVTEAMRNLRIREGTTNGHGVDRAAQSTSAIEVGSRNVNRKKESQTEESLEQIRSFCRYAWGKIEDTGSRILSSGRRTRSLSRAEARSRKKSL